MKAKFFKLLLSLGMLVLLTVVASVHPGSVYADADHCGTLSGNQTWSADANVHIVTCDVTIPAGVTLTIEAGAIIKFRQGADIYVNGKFIAQGTSSDPIYFTSWYDDSIGGDTDGGGPSAGSVADWGHIVFNSGSDDTSIITRTVIRYSGHNGNCCGVPPRDGAIFLSNSSPNLSYITFTSNYINGVEIAGGSWQTDTWDNTTIIYAPEGDLTVPAANTLTINPGMKIKLRTYVDIRVSGKLVASGTITDPIYFSSWKDDSLCGIGAFDEDICDTYNDGPTAGAVRDWGHIRFNSDSDDTSIITRAVIRYSGHDGACCSDNPKDGAIFLSNSSPSLSYITFTGNYINGVELDGGIDWQTDTWDNTTVIYVLEEGDLTIPAANTLTIAPGMKIKLSTYDDIRVSGKLVASGTTADPIYFSSYKDDTLCGLGAFDEAICDTHNDGPSAGAIRDWGHIVFNSGSDDTSIITRAVIRYSGNQGGCCGTPNDGAIFLFNAASPELSYITFTKNYINGVEIAGGNWQTDTWDNTTIIYALEGDLTIPAANTLTINPGMKIKLRDNTDIFVNGKLVVPGTTTNPIYFSSYRDDTLCGIGHSDQLICDTYNDDPTAGAVRDWGHIRFNSGSDDSSLVTRAVIRFSGDGNMGAIRLVSASPTISYTQIVNNYRGIEALSDSTPTLVCNDIYNNNDFGIYNASSTAIVITENHWWGHESGPYDPSDDPNDPTQLYNPDGQGDKVSDYVDYDPWQAFSCVGPPPPPAPTNLQASAISQTQINLTWQDNSSDETEFHIERSPNGSTGWTEIATVGTNVTSYNNTGLNCSTTYYYRVRGHRHSDGQFSGYSNVASAATYPCTPSNLSATAVLSTQINLTWQDNSPDETEFHIERSPNGSTGWAEIATVGANVTSYNNTGLSSDTTYYYRVRAHRHSDGAYSSYSNVASDQTPSPGQDADYFIHLPIILK